MLKKILIARKNPKDALEIFEVPEKQDTKKSGQHFDLADNQLAEVAEKIAKKRQKEIPNK